MSEQNDKCPKCGVRRCYKDVIFQQYECGSSCKQGVFKQSKDCELSTLRAENEKLKRPRCEHCGSDRIINSPPGCLICGAPNCCVTCCEKNTLEMENEQLKADVEKLRGAIKPFGKAANLVDEYPSLLSLSDDEKVQLEVKHFRHAAAVLEETK